MSLVDIVSPGTGGIGGVLGTLVTNAVQIFQAREAAKAAKALARSGRRRPSWMEGAMTFGGAGVPVAVGTGLGALAGGLGFLDPEAMEESTLLERLGLEGDLERETTLWRRTASGFSPVRTVFARHPTNGSIKAWEYRGQPVLYSGDLATCKRVNKIARRAAARSGLRIARRGRRR